MIYSLRIQKAIDFATKVHNIDQNQTRSDLKTPYITHPLAVALILARADADEDVIIAGILHDTIEDCIEDSPVTESVLSKEFGEKVASIVADLTEDNTIPKTERKQLAIDHILEMDKDALLVKAADQLHNLASMVEYVKEKGPHAFDHHESTKKEVMMWYDKRIDMLKKKWPDNPLLPELETQLTAFHELLQ